MKKLDWGLGKANLFEFLKQDQYTMNCKRIIIMGTLASGKSSVAEMISLNSESGIRVFDLGKFFNINRTPEVVASEKEALRKFFETKKSEYILSLSGAMVPDDDDIKLIKEAGADMIIFLNPPLERVLINLALEDAYKSRGYLQGGLRDIKDFIHLNDLYMAQQKVLEAFGYFRKIKVI